MGRGGEWSALDRFRTEFSRSTWRGASGDYMEGADVLASAPNGPEMGEREMLIRRDAERRRC